MNWETKVGKEGSRLLKGKDSQQRNACKGELGSLGGGEGAREKEVSWESADDSSGKSRVSLCIMQTQEYKTHTFLPYRKRCDPGGCISQKDCLPGPVL